jgi:predicted NACHT family NTPase
LSIPTSVNNLLVEDVAVAPQLTAAEPLPARLSPLRPTEQQADSSVTWDRLLEVSNHTVIVGDIGSGKTTLAQIVCQSLAHQYLETEDVQIPLYIPLLDLELFLQKHRETDPSGVAATIFHFMQNTFQSLGKDSFSTAFWQELLETYRVVLVLDGLDEVSVPDLQLYIVDHIRVCRRSSRCGQRPTGPNCSGANIVYRGC